MFAKMETSRLKLLAFASEIVSFQHGDIVLNSGDSAADFAYVIMDGAVDIITETDGGPVVTDTLRQNQLIGELGLLNNTPRIATLIANGDLQAMKITAEMFFRILRENSEVALDVIRMLSDKLTLPCKGKNPARASRNLTKTGASTGRRLMTSPAVEEISGLSRFQSLWRRCLIEGATQMQAPQSINAWLMATTSRNVAIIPSPTSIIACRCSINVNHFADNPDALEIAVWFHDVNLCNPGNLTMKPSVPNSTEDLSAGVHTDEFRELVDRLIIATLHNGVR